MRAARRAAAALDEPVAFQNPAHESRVARWLSSSLPRDQALVISAHDVNWIARTATHRMRELAVQSANASNASSDKDSLDKEFGELAKEMQRVLGGTTFNGLHVLASNAGAQVFQVGANTTSSDSISITTTDMTTDATITAVAGTDNAGSGRALIDASANNAAIQTVIGNIDTALDSVNALRATLGASQSRFDSVVSNLQISIENQSAARSRIIDTDFAAETARLSRANILQQAGNAMVAQANQLPQQVLQLLR